MSVIIRLQGLPWSASAMNIRHFFTGLSIPAGGVHIIGGDGGDAFIAFASDDDARMAMKRNMCPLNGTPVQLFLSSKSEMQSVIDAARSGSTTAAVPSAVPATAEQTMQMAGMTQASVVGMGANMQQPQTQQLQQNIMGNRQGFQNMPGVLPMDKQAPGENGSMGQQSNEQNVQFGGRNDWQRNTMYSGVVQRFPGRSAQGGMQQGGIHGVNEMGDPYTNNMASGMNQFNEGRQSMQNQSMTMNMMQYGNQQQSLATSDDTSYMNRDMMMKKTQESADQNASGNLQARMGLHQSPRNSPGLQHNRAMGPHHGDEEAAGHMNVSGSRGSFDGSRMGQASRDTRFYGADRFDDKTTLSETVGFRGMDPMQHGQWDASYNKLKDNRQPDGSRFYDTNTQQADALMVNREASGERGMGRDRHSKAESDMSDHGRASADRMMARRDPSQLGRIDPSEMGRQDHSLMGRPDRDAMLASQGRDPMMERSDIRGPNVDTSRASMMPGQDKDEMGGLDADPAKFRQAMYPGRFDGNSFIGGPDRGDFTGRTDREPIVGGLEKDVLMGRADRDSMARGRDYRDPMLGLPDMMGRPERDPLMGRPDTDSMMGRPNRDPMTGMRRPDRDPLMGRPDRDPLMGRPDRDPLMGRPDRDPLMERPDRDPLMGRPDRDPLMGRPDRDPMTGRPDRDPMTGMGRLDRDPMTGMGRLDRDPMIERPNRDSVMGGLERNSMLERRDRDPWLEGQDRNSMIGRPDRDYMAGNPNRDPIMGRLDRDAMMGRPDRDQVGLMERRDRDLMMRRPDQESMMTGQSDRNPMTRRPDSMGWPDRDPMMMGAPDRDSLRGRSDRELFMGRSAETDRLGRQGREFMSERFDKGAIDRSERDSMMVGMPGRKEDDKVMDTHGEMRTGRFDNQGASLFPQSRGAMGSDNIVTEPKRRTRPSRFSDITDTDTAPQPGDEMPSTQYPPEDFDTKEKGQHNRMHSEHGKMGEADALNRDNRGPKYPGEEGFHSQRFPPGDTRFAHGDRFPPDDRRSLMDTGRFPTEEGRFSEENPRFPPEGGRIDRHGFGNRPSPGDYMNMPRGEYGFDRGPGRFREDWDGFNAQQEGRMNKRGNLMDIDFSGRGHPSDCDFPPNRRNFIGEDNDRLMRGGFRNASGQWVERGPMGDVDPGMATRGNQSNMGDGGPMDWDQRVGGPRRPGLHQPGNENAFEHGRGQERKGLMGGDSRPMDHRSNFEKSIMWPPGGPEIESGRGRGEMFPGRGRGELFPGRGRGEMFPGRGRGGPPFGRGRATGMGNIDEEHRFSDVDRRVTAGKPEEPSAKGKPDHVPGKGLLGDAPMPVKDGTAKSGDAKPQETTDASKRDLDIRGDRRSDSDRDYSSDRDRRGRDRDREDRSRDRSSRYRSDRDRDRRRSRSRSRDRDRDRRRSKERRDSPRQPESRTKFVHLKNLPFSFTYKDIRRFFIPLEIPPDGLKVMNNEKGQRIGEAYVKFRHMEDATRAIRRTGARIDGRIVTINSCAEETFEKAIDSQTPLSVKKELPRMPQITPNEQTPNTVKLTNLPSKLTFVEISQFFIGIPVGKNGQAINIVRDKDGNCSGTAFVEMKTEFDYKKALALDGNLLSGKNIQIGPAKAVDKDNKSKPDPVNTPQVAKNMGGPRAPGAQGPVRPGVPPGMPAGVRPVGPQTPATGPRPGLMTAQGTPNVSQPGPTSTPGASPLPETVCVHIQGLPLLATPHDIRQFFTDCQIAMRGINIAHDSRGKPLGEGFVEFKMRADFEKAMKKDKTAMGRHIVAVKPIGKKEMVERLDRHQGSLPQSSPTQINVESNPQQQQQVQKSPIVAAKTTTPSVQPESKLPSLIPPVKTPEKPSEGLKILPGGLGCKSIPAGVLNKDWYYVRCQNFPSDISVKEILQFFQQFRPLGESIRLHYSSDGKPTGNAVVGFSTMEDAVGALQRMHLKNCRQNTVSVFSA